MAGYVRIGHDERRGDTSVSDALDLPTAWDRVLSSLAGNDVAPHQMGVLRLTRAVGMVEDTVLVAAPNEFTQKVLESRLRPQLTERLSRELDREVRIAVTVETALPDTYPTAGGQPANGQAPDRAAGNGVVADRSDTDHAAPPDHRPNEDRPAQDRPTQDRPTQDRPTQDPPEPSPQDRLGDERPGHLPAPDNVTSLNDHHRRHEAIDGVGDAEHASAADESSRGPLLSRTRSRVHPPARLNPKYTFDSFVIGNSNRFAHAAAFAVAEVRAYNPLFIYGESGLGKTHLLHAIGHYSEAFFPQHRVNYFTTEEFTNDFINQVHAGRAEEFRRRYRDVDLLLVDDVQFLERAERTQEEFFHTFNTLHSAGKQIVISSDRPPRQLTTLEDRLRTRFGWGLITDVQAPDLETRIAILRKKVAGDVLPEVAPEVLEYIASRIQTNIRELEGALIRVNAYASLNRTDVSIGLAEEVLRDLLPEEQGSKITATIIMSVTAEYFGITVEDLKGHSRSRVLVSARQIAMFLCRDQTELSLPRIGQIFGGKDHTTVMHAVKKISALMAERRAIFNQVTELTGRIKARARQ